MVSNQLFAMRRANGDWFALDERGQSGVPIFHSVKDAMTARSYNSGMECFRPVLLAGEPFQKLLSSDRNGTSFWLIEDPLLKLSKGRTIEGQELKQLSGLTEAAK